MGKAVGHSQSSGTRSFAKQAADVAAEETALATSIPQDLRVRLDVYETLLKKWQKTINLVAPSTLDRIWTRHFADSLQIRDLVPEARRWVDLGSGGGFPGLVTAIALTGQKDAIVHLIESDQRKCAFLREVARETGAPAMIHCGRIETVATQLEDKVDAVSARALAPLASLLSLAAPWLEKGAVGVFLKGAEAEKEMAEANCPAAYHLETHPSRTQPAARIILVRKF